MTEKVVHVVLNTSEVTALKWLAARYETAEFLFDHMEESVYDSIDQPAFWTIELTPDDCVDYLRLLADENGNPQQTVPTCAGGELKEKLMVAYHDAWSWAKHSSQ